MGDCTVKLGNAKLANQYLLSSYIQSSLYQEAYKSIKPDAIVLIHGIYQIHGIATKVANKFSIPVYVMGGGGIRKNTAIVCIGETYHHQLVNESNDIWNQKILSNAEKTKVLDYAHNKRSDGASVDYLNYHPSPINNIENIKNHIKFDKYKRVITLFTNVLWDAQVVYSSNLFKNIIDCIIKTIEIISTKKDTLLVIRIHPAEVKSAIPSRQKLSDELQPFVKDLCNVKIITPESDISSYKLAELSDVNVIYGTKMGLEMALMKRNLLICGESFSRNKGYGVDIKNLKQYKHELLSNKPSYNELEKRFQIALKYAYYLYFERMIDIPIESNSTEKGSINKPIIKIESLEHQGIKKIVNTIINNEATYKNYI